jgi:hypothetical protein
MIDMSLESAYQGLIDSMVQKILCKPTTWPALLAALPGVYPATVHDAALRMRLWDMVLHPDKLGAETETTGTVARLWEDGFLPTPHLLDASWWFADSALDSLLRRICQCGSRGDRVLLLGTPTLLQAAQDRAIPRIFTLVDREAYPLSGSVCERTIQADILLNQCYLADQPAVVVVDPPWYVAETRSFLLMARKNSRRNTRILLSTPPIGTRPGIGRDWTDLLAWCARIGLQLEEYLHSELAYVTPPFEQNAIRAAEVPECPLSWRRGDLAVFACVQDGPCPEPSAPSTPDELWHDVSIGRVRIRIRDGAGDPLATPALDAGVKGDVLPSVSRRDSRLGSVKIWTSGNRVFSTENVPAIRRIAEALAARESPAAIAREHVGTTVDGGRISQVETAARRIEEIVKVEEAELSNWKRRLNEQLVGPAS